jgi:hypothetical protein
MLLKWEAIDEEVIPLEKYEQWFMIGLPSHKIRVDFDYYYYYKQYLFVGKM